MTPVEYNEAFRDGAHGMRSAIKGNMEVLKKRMLRDKEEGRIPPAAEFDIDNLFTNIYNMIDIRIDGEPDREDVAYDDTGKV